jgi:hypothetical protein
MSISAERALRDNGDGEHDADAHDKGRRARERARARDIPRRAGDRSSEGRESGISLLSAHCRLATPADFRFLADMARSDGRL